MTQSDAGSLTEADSLVQRFICAEDVALSESLLARLISEHAEPLIRKVICAKLASGWAYGAANELQEEADIRQDVIIHLVRHLRKLREETDQFAITSFQPYVSRCALNGYYKYLQTRYPVRWRFKNRLRYLLNHSQQFKTWEGEQGEITCGLREWQDLVPVISSSVAQELLGHEFIKSANFSVMGEIRAQRVTPVVIESFLRWFAAPISVDALTVAMADICQISEPRPIARIPVGKVQDPGDLVRDPSPSPEFELDERAYLGQLWKEICELPLNQRIALLFGMREAQNSSALNLFTDTGIVSLREIAQTVSYQLDAFAELWNRLPLDDNSIAASIGVTRQQVINLRKSARERLARRTQHFGKKRCQS